VLCASGVASAAFVNGGFEAGNLSGWTVTPTGNGAASVQTVELFDIDGPGALGDSLAGKFSVGNAVSPNQGEQGIDLTQTLSLTGGVTYTFSFDWAAIRTTTSTNSQGGVFSVVVDGALFGTQAAGSTNSLTPHYGSISVDFTPGASGNYEVGARITRPFTIPGVGGAETLFQYVDNFDCVPAPSALGLLGLGALAGVRRRR